MNIKWWLLLLCAQVSAALPMRRTTTRLMPTMGKSVFQSHRASNPLYTGMRAVQLQTRSTTIAKGSPWFKTVGLRCYSATHRQLNTIFTSSKKFVGPLIAGTAVGAYLGWPANLQAQNAPQKKVEITLKQIHESPSWHIYAVTSSIKQDANLKNHYIQFCKENFNELIKHENGRYFLICLIDEQHLIKTFEPYFLNSFIYLAQGYWGIELLKNLIDAHTSLLLKISHKTNDDLFFKLITKIQDNIADILECKYGYSLIELMLDTDSRAVVLIQNHFDSIVKALLSSKNNIYAASFLNIYKKNKKSFALTERHVRNIIEMLLENNKVGSICFELVIQELLEIDKGNAIILVQVLFEDKKIFQLNEKYEELGGIFDIVISQKEAQRILSIFLECYYLQGCDNLFTVGLIKKLVDRNKDFSKEIMYRVFHNFEAVCKTSHGLDLITHLTLNDSSLKQQWKEKVVTQIAEHIQSIHFFAFESAINCFGDDPCIEQALEQYLKKTHANSLDALLKAKLYAHTFKKEINNAVITPTLTHLYLSLHQSSHENNMCESLLKNYYNDIDLRNMLERIVMFEKEFGKDYYTFFHGQRNDYLLVEQLHTLLDGLRSNKQHKDFLYLHVKEPFDYLVDYQEWLIQKGYNDQKDVNNLLFTNFYFFGNSTNPGSSTAGYIRQNFNVRFVSISFKDAFYLHNYSGLYEKYQARLGRLNQELEELSKYGTCIFLAVPKKMVHKTVYLAAPGGYKRTLKIKGQRETDDIKLILETLLHNPDACENPDKVEFCITMTGAQDAMDPESGIKIFAFNAAHDSALEAWYMQRDQLFEEIKKDIQLLKAEQYHKEQAVA